jgi:hypothetical protein
VDIVKRELDGNDWGDLRIVTNDEHVAKLPWSLLFNNGVFLSAARWAVSLSTNARCPEYELPPSPRMLIVVPQPSGYATQAESHVEALEELLSGADRLLRRGRNLRVITTWEDFKKSLSEFSPHIIYFYGHGVGDSNSSRLVFETGRGGRAEKPIADVANLLQVCPEQVPLLAYLNCCQGDAGGVLGAGRQLGRFVPAVITNYGLVSVSTAQAQAQAILRSILLDAAPPHVAVARMRYSHGALDLSFGDLRWMTPILHCHYSTWKASRPKRDTPLERDSHWRFKLDRVRQFSEVLYLTMQMLAERKPRSRAYVWYGKEGQGVDLFHQRLKIELPGCLHDTYLYEVRPEWPVEFQNPYRSFEDMFTEAFEVQSLQDVPARIRTQTRGVSGRQTLIYIRHRPVRTSKLFSLAMLKRYLEWWEYKFVPILESGSYALLGVSFVVGNPQAFLRAYREGERVGDLDYENTVIQLLDEMDHLAWHDLVDFLKTHNIRLPSKRRELLLNKILEETGGSYEMTLESLKDIAESAWDIESDGTDVIDVAESYDYD